MTGATAGGEAGGTRTVEGEGEWEGGMRGESGLEGTRPERRASRAGGGAGVVGRAGEGGIDHAVEGGSAGEGTEEGDRAAGAGVLAAGFGPKGLGFSEERKEGTAKTSKEDADEVEDEGGAEWREGTHEPEGSARDFFAAAVGRGGGT